MLDSEYDFVLSIQILHITHYASGTRHPRPYVDFSQPLQSTCNPSIIRPTPNTAPNTALLPAAAPVNVGAGAVGAGPVFVPVPVVGFAGGDVFEGSAGPTLALPVVVTFLLCVYDGSNGPLSVPVAVVVAFLLGVNDGSG